MKDYLELAQKIDKNRLYTHIYNLQGIRHPIVAMSMLTAAADYIKSEFEKIGLEVTEEPFEIEGFATPFRNIVAKLDLSHGTADEAIISGHHDTVYDAPGANDNATACAIIIETAKIIYENRTTLSGNYRFVSFDLEEGNPAVEKHVWALGEKYGVRDKNFFTTLAYKKNHEESTPYLVHGLEEFRAKLKTRELDANEEKYYGEMLEYYATIFNDGKWVGVLALMGSSHYAAQAKLQGRKIKGVINLDTVGYTADRKNSQIYPENIPVNLLKIITKPILRSLPFITNQFKTVGIKDVTVGDFASLIVDINSTDEADLFLSFSKELNLKTAAIYTGMDFDKVASIMPDLLRSDHAPFWREGIPAIFISDSANFRYPYYHTGADTINHLDFEFIKRVAQVSLLTLISMASDD